MNGAPEFYFFGHFAFSKCMTGFYSKYELVVARWFEYGSLGKGSIELPGIVRGLVSSPRRR